MIKIIFAILITVTIAGAYTGTSIIIGYPVGLASENYDLHGEYLGAKAGKMIPYEVGLRFSFSPYQLSTNGYFGLIGSTKFQYEGYYVKDIADDWISSSRGGFVGSLRLLYNKKISDGIYYDISGGAGYFQYFPEVPKGSYLIRPDFSASISYKRIGFEVNYNTIAWGIDLYLTIFRNYEN